MFVKSGRNGEMLFTTFCYKMSNQDDVLVAILAWTEVQFS